MNYGKTQQKLCVGGKVVRLRKIIRMYACFSSSILLVVAALYTGCSSNIYNGEQHIQEIRERAEERYLGKGSAYTALEVYPIYDERDEVAYALIEFEPRGFIYVCINDQEYPWRSMYTLSSLEPESWMPYRVKEGALEDILDVDGNIIAQTFNREFFRDDNGQVIVYDESHFKVAGVGNERYYFLSTVLTVYFGHTNGLIPAVKRGDKYLDLVDGEMIDYTPGMESAYTVADIEFINKANFDL